MQVTTTAYSTEEGQTGSGSRVRSSDGKNGRLAGITICIGGQGQTR